MATLPEQSILVSCWTASVGGSCSCLASEGRLIGVSTDSGILLLDAQESGRIVWELTGHQGGTTALAFSCAEAGHGGQQLRLWSGGADGCIRIWNVDSGEEEVAVSLVQEGLPPESEAASVMLLSRHPERDVFAAIAGRFIFVLNKDGAVQHRLELDDQPGECELAPTLVWCNVKDTLIATTRSGSLISWTDCGAQPGPKFAHSGASGSSVCTCVSVSPTDGMLAARRADSKVQTWVLEDQLSQESQHHAVQLHWSCSVECSADSKVAPLTWSRTGQYLASSEGAEALVWDMSQEEPDSGRSIVCCGHSPSSRITTMAFQPDGNLLATAGDDARVLFFDTQSFHPGCVVSQTTSTNGGGAGDAITALQWLPGGLLIASSTHGNVAAWEVNRPTSPAPKAAPPVAETVTVPFHLPTPMPMPQEALGGDAASPAAAGEASVQSTSSASLPASLLGPTTPASIDTAVSRARAAAALASGPPVRVPERKSSGELSSSYSSVDQVPLQERPQRRRSGGSDTWQQAARGRIAAGAAANHVPNGSAAAHAGTSGPPFAKAAQGQLLSSSLMQHIQHIRQHSPTSSSQQQELSGWGSGFPSAKGPPPPQRPREAATGGAAAAAAGRWSPPTSLAAPTAASGSMVGMQYAAGPMPGYQPYILMQPGAMPGSPGGAVPLGYMPMQGQMMQPGTAHMMGPMPGGMAPKGAMPMVYAPGPHQLGQPWGPGVYWPGSPHAPGHLPPQMGWHPGFYAANYYQQYPGQGLPPQGPGMRAQVPSAALLQGRSPAFKGHPQPPPLSAMPPRGLAQHTPRSPLSPTLSLDRHGRQTSSEPATSDAEAQYMPMRSDTLGSEQESESSSSLNYKMQLAADAESHSAMAGVTTLYVGNLPSEVNEYALEAVFNCFGPITHIQVLRDRTTLESRGFGFVTFAHPTPAAVAMQQMNGQVLYGPFRDRQLKVAPSLRGQGTP